MSIRKLKETTSGQLFTTRETLPTIEPTYTNQTITINPRQSNIKHPLKAQIKFTTVEKSGNGQNKSLLQIPLDYQQYDSKKDLSTWIINKDLRQLSKKDKEKASDSRFFNSERRNRSTNKYESKSILEVTNTTSSDNKLNTLKTKQSITRGRNRSEKDSFSVRKRRFISPKQKSNLLTSESPYCLSYTQKMESKKTIVFRTAQKNNNTRFRATKYFFSTKVEPKMQTQKDDEDLLGVINNSTYINQNISTVWNNYLDNQLNTNIKSRFDIQSYINTVRIPLYNTSTSEHQISKMSQNQKNSLPYDFSFQEQKRIQVQGQPKQPLSYRRKAYANSNKHFYQKTAL